MVAGLVNAQWSQYKKGYVINTDSTTIEGYIHHYGGSGIWYKKSEKEEKKRYEPGQISGFVIGNDHYTILKNLKVRPWTSLFNFNIKSAFVKVLIKGDLSLYELKTYTGMTNGATTEHHILLVQKSGEQKVYQVPKSNNKFNQLMQTITSEYPEFYEQSKNKYLGHQDVGRVISDYNHFKMNPKP